MAAERLVPSVTITVRFSAVVAASAPIQSNKRDVLPAIRFKRCERGIWKLRMLEFLGFSHAEKARSGR
jgi:hypothetical protein